VDGVQVVVLLLILVGVTLRVVSRYNLEVLLDAALVEHHALQAAVMVQVFGVLVSQDAKLRPHHLWRCNLALSVDPNLDAIRAWGIEIIILKLLQLHLICNFRLPQLVIIIGLFYIV